ncbi:MAG: diguanylate cyclase [Selenomonadaceae bacterium]|nr:diguanylate cyclase [Selenomonadaceae bacterium]
MSKILIVDDDEMMLMMARHILSSRYETVTATTGAEAIEIFEQEKPDMVLSDLMMPEMDGYELHRILQEKTSETLPVMFMSANEGDESEIKGFEVGAADYIHKPLRPDVLLRRVGNIIDNLDKIHGLEVAASTDPLTKLLNKSGVQKEIGDLVKKSNGALLMIDLDSFKLVNDIYGHNMGDKILIFFGELIKKIIRANDLAGRQGGDEFIAFLQNVDDEKILQDKTVFLNEQILIAAKKFMGADMEIPLGTSIGAVFVPDEGRDFQMLCKKADSALYKVKQNGKHGISIFGAHSHEKKVSVEGISQMRMILAERNIEPGAYFVEFEDFKKIYRLLSRMADNYKKGLTLMQFTLPEKSFAEEFKEILLKSLRKSDCVTQSGNKFLVLLMEATEEESDKVKKRIFSRLKNFFVDNIGFEREGIF